MTDDIAVSRGRKESLSGAASGEMPATGEGDRRARRDELVVERFDATAQSVTAARRFVVDVLRRWDVAAVADDAAMCVSELAANAVLHGRGPFDVVVRSLDGGVGVHVIDPRPAELPSLVPCDGTAADLTRRAATGRGLQIVSGLASRWGFTTSDTDKAVWAELTSTGPGPSREPVTVLAHRPEPPADPVTLELRSLPVRAAVASGLQVDDLVRGIQLAQQAAPPAPQQVERLHRLLDASASVRLTGRHAALRAAGAGQHRYDLTLHTSHVALAAVGRLAGLLEDLAAPRISSEVSAFRTWLEEETARQLSGRPPSPCPLP